MNTPSFIWVVSYFTIKNISMNILGVQIYAFEYITKSFTF